MHNQWIPILNKLPLSRTEKAVVKRFEADPAGRSFLPVSDILRSHRKPDESLELLMQGVQAHPSFTVARVVLARELYNKGMVAEAWQILEASPVSLHENVLAQKLRLKLALLQGFDEFVQATHRHMQTYQMLDVDTKDLMATYEVSGPQVAREQLLKELRQRGIEVHLSPPAAMRSFAGLARSPALPPTPELPSEASLAQAGADFMAQTAASVQQSFHVVPLAEVFQPSDSAAMPATSATSVELDTTTLGEIYVKQGHFTKALAIYKRLLHMTPNNELLKRRVIELARMEREQRDVDMSIDPSVVDSMETVELIDRQIRFYNRILDRLN